MISGLGLLSGLNVLDFSIWRPGPYATQLLAELGAEVIKVEPPGGDPMRTYPELFATLNVNKRSVELDLKSDAGRERAHSLAEAADVVVEGFRPGVAARLGISYDDLVPRNPSLIYCSISGLGQTGPLAHASGHDLNYQAWAGALAPDGGVPRIPALPIADLAGGLTAAFGICAAAFGRAHYGTGEYLDVSMADVLATWTGVEIPVATGVDQDTRGVPGYGTFATRDGAFVALGVLTEDHFWRALCDELGLTDRRDDPFTTRMADAAALNSAIESAIATRDRDALVAALVAAGVPAAPVLDRAAMTALEHFRTRGTVATNPWSTNPSSGFPVNLRNQPPRRVQPAPALDEHHDATFAH